MVQKVFTTPFAKSGSRTAIPDASQPTGEVSYTVGFGPDYERQLGVDPLAKNIERENFNQSLFDVTTSLQEFQAGLGSVPFNLTLANSLTPPGYPKAAVIPRADFNGYWMSTVAGNLTDPATGGNWVAITTKGSNFAVDTGTANTYVCAFTPAIAARVEGQVLMFKVKTANTGASTINDGVGVVALVGGAQTALQGGELIANGDAWVQWNTSVGGGSYVLLFCTGAPEQVAPATQSQHAVTMGQLQSGASNFVVATGSTNAFVANFTPAISSLTDGLDVSFKANGGNTGPATLNVNGLGALAIVGGGLAALQGGEIVVNGIVTVRYNASIGNWSIREATGGAAQVGTASASLQAMTASQVQAGFGSFAADIGVANALVVNLSPVPAALVDGMQIRVLAASGNSGATTLNLNGLGVKAVIGLGGFALQGGELVTGGRALLIWAAAQNSFILLSCQTASLQIANGTQSHHAMALGQATGRLLNIQFLTASGTYTPTPGTVTIVAEAQGCGGAGGGVAATGAGNSAAGGGGSAGTTAATGRLAAPGPIAITIGAAGVGVAGAAGGVGGGVTLAGIISCGGGGGGLAGVNSTTASVSAAGGALSGAASGPTAWAGFGQRGAAGLCLSSSSAVGGDGGGTLYSGGGAGAGNNGTSATAGGASGGFGSGGGGACAIASGAAVAGGNGGAGFIIVYEYS